MVRQWHNASGPLANVIGDTREEGNENMLERVHERRGEFVANQQIPCEKAVSQAVNHESTIRQWIKIDFRVDNSEGAT